MEELMQNKYIRFDDLTETQKKYFKDADELPNCVFLQCNSSQLEKLPKLPNCKTLYCVNNWLHKLPDLPNCAILWCDINLLTELPNLPNCADLSCRNNRLTELPNLPKCIYLTCSKNQLTKLPELRKYTSIQCANNPQLFYPKSIATEFHLKYPSECHHIHYVEKWQTAFHMLRKIKLLKQITGIDEYLAYEIVRNT